MIVSRGRVSGDGASRELKWKPAAVEEPAIWRPRLVAGTLIQDWTTAIPASPSVAVYSPFCSGVSVPSAVGQRSALPSDPGNLHRLPAEASFQVASVSTQERAGSKKVKAWPREGSTMCSPTETEWTLLPT